MQWSLRFKPEARRRSASGGRMQWSLRFEPEARKKKAGGEARLGEREPPDRCGTTITKSGERPGRAREGAFGHHGCAGWRWPLASFQDAVKVERRCSGVRWFPLAALVSPPAHVSRASGSEENFSLRILDFEFRVSSFEPKTSDSDFPQSRLTISHPASCCAAPRIPRRQSCRGPSRQPHGLQQHHHQQTRPLSAS